jgi:hypothetical protein
MKRNYDLAKSREIELVKCLNKELFIPEYDSIVEFIYNLPYNWVNFEHSGSNQSEPGDLLGYTSDKVISIEVKICDTSKSTESHGGGGRDIFKTLDSKILGYGEFENKVNAPQQRWDIINQTLNTNISSYKEQDKLKLQIKSNLKLVNKGKGELEILTNNVKIQYIDYLISIIKNLPEDNVMYFFNAIALGYRKNLTKLKNLNTDILEIQVGYFNTEKQIISSKTFTPKTQLKNIYRSGLALVLESEEGFIKFPFVHGNGYQGSGKTLSCKYMFKY